MKGRRTITAFVVPLAAVVSLVGAGLVAGCAKDVPPPGVAADEFTIYPRVTATGGLNSVLRVRESGFSKSTDPVLRVTVPVRNTAERTKFVQYRFFFFDADGEVVDANPTWTRTRIAPGAEVYMQGAAIAEQEASDFRLEIRPQTTS